MFSKKLIPSQGKLLVAEPFMKDVHFKRSVVMLAECNEKGAFGFILNKPIEMEINNAISDFPDYDGKLFYGGPVNNDQLFYIHTFGDQVKESQLISNGLYFGGDFNSVKKLIKSGKAKPGKIKFFAGYAGWDAKQLEDELNIKSWIVADDTMNLSLTEENTTDMWSKILKTLGKEYAMIANFPEDPSLN